MATGNQTPKRGGSHFGAPAPRQQADPQAVSAPRPATGASAPRSALAGGRVSSRTAAATRRAGSHSVQRADRTRRRSRAPLVVLALVVVAALASIVFVVVPSMNRGSDGPTQEVTPGNQVTITVPEGSGAAAVAQLLYDNGVIANQSEFLSQVRRTDAEQAIKSGSYTLTTGDDYSNIISLLTSGPNAGVTVTVPEGYTVAQTASAVEAALGIPAADFTAQAKASNYVADFPFLADVGDDSLEGYLFPKTYSFTSESPTADEVVRAMLSQYATETSGIDFDSSIASIRERYGIDVNEDDIVTLASIVEREAINDDQRGLVASVFYNRLAAGMPLQSDATLTYSLGRAPTADELQTSTDPYNTYNTAALTPTPICSPSLASLVAAASPDDTDYYYFFISGEDYSVFSETYEQHQQAIANRPQ